nr:hypothetical protein [Escherichia coli]
MNKELGYPSKYLFKKLIDTSESICSPSCDEKKALIKNKNKESHNQMRIMSNNTMGFITQKLCYSQSLPFHLANTTWLMIKEGIEKKFITNRQFYKIKTDLMMISSDWHIIMFMSFKTHQTKIQNYVALYGFCRNICLIFIISFWVSVPTFIYRLCTHSDYLYSLLSIMLSFFFVYVFYVGFVKFYRRYTLEVLMAFAVLQSNDTIR